MRGLLTWFNVNNTKHSKCKKTGMLVDSELHQSEVINVMRFPLIVMVILFHLYPPEDIITSPYRLYNIIVTFFSSYGIARLAVPTFFIISGYFFYYHLKEWNSKIYVIKLRKRLHTLLIPYLLWNGIPIILIIMVRLFIGMSSGTSLSLVREFGDSISWFRGFWDCGVIKGHPFDVPLWYIRDLIICSICSPVIYFLVKRLGLLYVLGVGLLFLTNTWIDVTGFDARGWFFFSFGAYLSINNINMVCLFRKYATVVIPFATVLLIVTTYFGTILGKGLIFFDNLFLLFGICAIIGCFSLLVSNRLVCNIPFLTKSVFFIYAFHVFPIPIIVSVTAFCEDFTARIIVDTQVLTYILQFVICPIIVLCICLAVYFCMHRFTPRFLSVLTGQR